MIVAKQLRVDQFTRFYYTLIRLKSKDLKMLLPMFSLFSSIKWDEVYLAKKSLPVAGISEDNARG